MGVLAGGVVGIGASYGVTLTKDEGLEAGQGIL